MSDDESTRTYQRQERIEIVEVTRFVCVEKKEVDLMACMIPNWSVFNKVLRRCGFVPCPKGLNPKKEPFLIYPISKDIDLDVVKDPKNWFITWGDSDVV